MPKASREKELPSRCSIPDCGRHPRSGTTRTATTASWRSMTLRTPHRSASTIAATMTVKTKRDDDWDDDGYSTEYDDDDDWSSPNTGINDWNGHGTHITSVMVGSGRTPAGRYQGIAPDANIVAIRAFEPDGSGYLPECHQGAAMGRTASQEIRHSYPEPLVWRFACIALLGRPCESGRNGRMEQWHRCRCGCRQQRSRPDDHRRTWQTCLT